MPDRRAAILARCDELERLAQMAHDWRPTRWFATGDVVSADVVSAAGVRSTDEVAVAHSRTSPLIAAFDPKAVFELVAGVREMVAIHAPVVDMAMALFKRREVCAVCRTPEQWRGGQDWGSRRVDGPCPTLATLARMLGIEDA